jgi:hypothetical protein
MSLTRRWNPFTRWRRAATAAAELPASKDSAGHIAAAAMPATAPVTRLALPDKVVLSTDGAPEPAASSDDLRETGAIDAETPEERRVRFFCWLVGAPEAPNAGSPPAAVIPRTLQMLDRVIASEALRASLLPRAPHVVPPLMKTLRDEHYSSADVATRISKDVVLTAEVIRSATSAFQRGDDDGEVDLARAVAMIGAQGLRRVIANVILRPIFDARGDTLSARAATQIWKDADTKARLCAALASLWHSIPSTATLRGCCTTLAGPRHYGRSMACRASR